MDWNNHRAVLGKHSLDGQGNTSPSAAGIQNPVLTRTVGRPLIWVGVIALLLGASFGWIMSSLGY